MDDDRMEESLRILEHDLDVASGFLVSLWAERTDWSFVIKTHALLETALSQLLGAHLFDRRLDPLVQALPVGGRGGKVAFLKTMDLLTSGEEEFINESCHLRNRLVHNVHCTRFDFQTFLATDPDQARKLAKAAAKMAGSVEIRRKYEADFEGSLRTLLWGATLFVVAKSRKALAVSENERRKLEEHVRRFYRD